MRPAGQFKHIDIIDSMLKFQSLLKSIYIVWPSAIKVNLLMTLMNEWFDRGKVCKWQIYLLK